MTSFCSDPGNKVSCFGINWTAFRPEIIHFPDQSFPNPDFTWADLTIVVLWNSDTTCCGKYRRSSDPDKFCLGHTRNRQQLLLKHLRYLKRSNKCKPPHNNETITLYQYFLINYPTSSKVIQELYKIDIDKKHILKDAIKKNGKLGNKKILFNI